jgi:hypothetical protein
MNVATGAVLDFRTIGDPTFDELDDTPTELVRVACIPIHALLSSRIGW